EGPAADRNPWHPTINRYFRGYVRRSGVDLAPDLLDRLLFLPARQKGVFCYGGGFAIPRIVSGPVERELALGPLPDEIPERATNPTQKDFLFGALLREVGRSLRGESLFETLRLSVSLQWDRMSAPTRAVLAPGVEIYQRFLSRGPAMIADAWTALNQGRDHLL